MTAKPICKCERIIRSYRDRAKSWREVYREYSIAESVRLEHYPDACDILLAKLKEARDADAT